MPRLLGKLYLAYLFVAAILIGIAYFAEQLGLGLNDEFVLYEMFGISRRELAEHTIFFSGIVTLAGIAFIFRRLIINSLRFIFTKSFTFLRLPYRQLLRDTGAFLISPAFPLIIAVSCVMAIISFEVYARIILHNKLGDWINGSSLFIQSETL
jgi:hypothetical protein